MHSPLASQQPVEQVVKSHFGVLEEQPATTRNVESVRAFRNVRMKVQPRTSEWSE